MLHLHLRLYQPGWGTQPRCRLPLLPRQGLWRYHEKRGLRVQKLVLYEINWGTRHHHWCACKGQVSIYYSGNFYEESAGSLNTPAGKKDKKLK